MLVPFNSEFKTDASNFAHHELGLKEAPQGVSCQVDSEVGNEIPPILPHKHGTTMITSTSEYEDTSGFLPPPPLPPKSRKT